MKSPTHAGLPFGARFFALAALTSALSLPAGMRAQEGEDWDVTLARGETREIDFVTEEGTWLSLDVSPDGQWVVMDLLGHIYRVPMGGGEAELLTQESG